MLALVKNRWLIVQKYIVPAEAVYLILYSGVVEIKRSKCDVVIPKQ